MVVVERKSFEEIRDISLSRAYGLGAVALGQIAEVGQRVPLVGDRVSTLKARAAALERAGQAMLAPPIKDYDELNVKQVIENLEGLTRYELEKVRRYEVDHKDRVTVLRDVDARLSGPAQA